MEKNNRPVVVTGMGATTPLGGSVASTWDALLAGRSGVRRLPHEWADELPVRIAAEIAVEPAELFPPARVRKLDRSAQFALIAAREAWDDAGFKGRAGEDERVDPDRLGVVVATAVGGVTSMLQQYDVLKARGARKVSPHTVPMMMANTSSAHISIEVGARAGAHTLASACASGAEAIGYAIAMIRSGRSDVVIAGGTEAVVHPLYFAAFGNMMAMSKNNDDPTRASRPFDTRRDGFVLGEGAGLVVLESAEHAARRGARVYAEALGEGLSSDGHHMTQPEPVGRGISAALRSLTDSTGLEPTEIAHVNAHATSTRLGDIAEIRALRQVFGDHTDHFAISATKSMTGHLIGGAGGIETIATVLALYHRLAPPTINLDDLDPEIDADIVRGEPRPLPDGRIAALNNSFGFGGHNVVLAFRTV
ncbi:MAG TPA: beta-ketoacyl-[acyl-carrier-protein] synthase family protein [Streptomyces sp.]